MGVQTESSDVLSDALLPLLIKSLLALAQAGAPDAACRIAGQAHALLRLPHPRGAGKINALLHRLAPMKATEDRL